MVELVQLVNVDLMEMMAALVQLVVQVQLGLLAGQEPLE